MSHSFSCNLIDRNDTPLLKNGQTLGFIVIGTTENLIGTVSESRTTTLHKFKVDLTTDSKESALHKARLKLEKKHNYIRKITELSAQFFIDDATQKCTVDGIVLAGGEEFDKSAFSSSDLLNPILRNAIIKTVDVTSSGDKGFLQAIETI
jgi:peptide chain release factor subunit 1